MTDNLTVITNRQPRNVLCWYELTAKEQAEFDYITDECGSFVRYRGATYDLGDMLRAPNSLPYWHAIHSDSYFSGVLFRLSRDGETVICGRYYS